MVEGEVVVEGEDGVGTGVGMETTKVEITKVWLLKLRFKPSRGKIR